MDRFVHLLLMKYDCHVSADVVTASSRVKYLFKYVAKGADVAKARIAGILPVRLSNAA